MKKRSLLRLRHAVSRQAGILIILTLLFLAAASLFLLWGLHAGNWEYNLPRRAVKLAAIALTGTAVASATVVFQTMVGNRILTPSVMGLDSLYVFLQTLILFLLGAQSLALMSRMTDFLLSVVLMAGFSLVLYRFMFKDGSNRMFSMLLIGMMVGSLFSSLSTFMQVLIDPNEFLVVQARMYASFNNVNTALLGGSAVLLAVTLGYIQQRTQKLDVMSLGRDIAVNLGIPYEREARRFMLVVAVMTAVSTALVGPVTFLGILVANLSRRLLSTYRHSMIIAGASLISMTALIGGQFLVERVFAFSTPISVVINFVGGIYFLYLLYREGRM